MLHINAKTFTSAAEIIAHRKAIREKFYRPTIRNVAAEEKARREREAEEARREKERQLEAIKREKEEAEERERRAAMMAHFEAQALAKAREEVKIDMEALRKSVRASTLQEIFGASCGDPEAAWREYGKKMAERRRPVLDIIHEVLARHGNEVTIEQILGPRGSVKVVAQRFECIWEIRRQRPDMSSNQIARKFNRDHSTVHHAIKMHNKAIGANLSTSSYQKKDDAEPDKPKVVKDIPQSGVRGISWYQSGKTWRVRLYRGDQCITIGYFKDLERAKAALLFAKEGKR